MTNVIELQWNGMPQYRCLRCPYDSLRRERLVEHMMARHGVAAVFGKQEEPGEPLVSVEFVDTSHDDAEVSDDVIPAEEDAL